MRQSILYHPSALCQATAAVSSACMQTCRMSLSSPTGPGELTMIYYPFLQNTKLKPNSFVFLSIPDASHAQWHPFTLSIVRNSTDPDTPVQAALFVRPYGSWVQVPPPPLCSPCSQCIISFAVPGACLSVQRPAALSGCTGCGLQASCYAIPYWPGQMPH